MKLTLKQLKNIINSYIEAANYKPDDNNNEAILFSMNVEKIIDIMFNLYFGETNTDLIYGFILKTKNNKFETIEQLYDYLSDKYSELVRKDSALTIEQLRILFPQEEMFKFFEKVIKEMR